MKQKPNFIHQKNHAGKVFAGNTVWMAYYMVNRTLDKSEKHWCIRRIKRKKHRNRHRYKSKYKNNYENN